MGLYRNFNACNSSVLDRRIVRRDIQDIEENPKEDVSSMVWQYEKFKGDMAIYAVCPKCGFYHNPSKFYYTIMECEIQYQYHYCPMCGACLYNERAETDGVEITWNERNIEELYKE